MNARFSTMKLRKKKNVRTVNTITGITTKGKNTAALQLRENAARFVSGKTVTEMYEELVARLRKRAVNLKEKFSRNAELLSELMQSADAIEELSREVKSLEKILGTHPDPKGEPGEPGVPPPRWIPVTERLPEKGKRVLCACRANIFCVLKWDGIDWNENPTHIYMRGFVTHWMPLPEPPQEETE